MYKYKAGEKDKGEQVDNGEEQHIKKGRARQIKVKANNSKWQMVNKNKKVHKMNTLKKRERAIDFHTVDD